MDPEDSALHCDALADNLPSCIENLRIVETTSPPALATTSNDDTGIEDHATDTFAMRRTRDLRRLLLDERFVSLRRVAFTVAPVPEAKSTDVYHHEPSAGISVSLESKTGRYMYLS
jgi:hypothetical protein